MIFFNFEVSKDNLRDPKSIVVNEEDNLRLQCGAVGFPVPKIFWQKDGVAPMGFGKWKDNFKMGRSINITSINRVHTGKYVCIAENGIPPNAQHSFQVEVNCKSRYSLIFWDF